MDVNNNTFVLLVNLGSPKELNKKSVKEYLKNKQLLGSGCGQTSRVDALKQAILKAKKFFGCYLLLVD